MNSVILLLLPASYHIANAIVIRFVFCSAVLDMGMLHCFHVLQALVRRIMDLRNS